MRLSISRYFIVEACTIALATTAFAAASAQGTGHANTKNMPASHAANHTVTGMSHQAADIFKQVNLADQALGANQKTVAEHHITLALNDRNELAATAKAKDLPMVVPIFSELEDQTTIGPVLAAKNQGKKQPNMKSPIAVDDASDQFTYVGIDLDKTKSRLDAARDAIRNNNMQAAKDTLSAIGDDLVVTSIDADRPLLAARENLGIAQNAAKRHSYKEAQGALKEASTDLADYAKNSSAKHSQNATELKAKIDKLSESITQKQGSVEGTLEQWWSEVDGWMQHPTA